MALDGRPNPRAVSGDNNPPDPLLLEAEERVDAANKWITERPDITDMDMADRANVFASQCQATWKALDDQRLEEGRAFDATQAAKYKTPLTLLKAARDRILVLRTAFLKKEEDRLDAQRKAAAAEVERARKEAEDAVRRAQEAAKKKGGDVLRTELAAGAAAEAVDAAQEKAEAVPDRAQIRGTSGMRAVGLKDHWSAEITDISAAFKHYNKKGTGTKAALEKAIRETIARLATDDARIFKDEAKAPPGIRFVKDRR